MVYELMVEFNQFISVRYAATINSLKKKIIFLHSVSKFIKLSKRSTKEEIENKINDKEETTVCIYTQNSFIIRV